MSKQFEFLILAVTGIPTAAWLFNFCLEIVKCQYF
ncbi:hypothetical protein VP236O401_P0007 [Vibrio phage 236O40-1]|nr:hypothetical protein VP236O401_P0007 [Vibrio phage 236O40-1]